MLNFVDFFQEIRKILFKKEMLLFIFLLGLLFLIIIELIDGSGLDGRGDIFGVLFFITLSIFIFLGALFLRRKILKDRSQMLIKNVIKYFFHYLVILFSLFIITAVLIVIISLISTFIPFIPSVSEMFEIKYLAEIIIILYVSIFGLMLGHFFLEKKLDFRSLLSIFHKIKTRFFSILVFLAFIGCFTFFSLGLLRQSLFLLRHFHFPEYLIGWFDTGTFLLVVFMLLTFQLVFMNKLNKSF